MPSTAVTIRPAAEPDHDHIAALLATTVAASRVARWLLPDSDRRRHRARLYVQYVMDVVVSAPYATAYVTGDGHAAAVFYDHTGDQGTSPLTGISIDLGFLGVITLVEDDPCIRSRIVQLQQTLADTTDVEPHHRLAYLGVAEHQRRRGLAQALLQHHHTHHPDAAGYALAQTPADQHLLASAGYILGQPTTLAGPLTLRPARRPPRPRPATARSAHPRCCFPARRAP